MSRLAVEKQIGFEVVYRHSSGGMVWQHELVNVRTIDYKDILEIAMDKAQLGCEVQILPTLPEDHLLRKIVFVNAKERKCPDLKVDGRYVEVKIPIGMPHLRKISNNIKFAYAQANEVIIKLSSSFSIEALTGIAKGRFLTHRNLILIEFKLENKYYSFKRSDLV